MHSRPSLPFPGIWFESCYRCHEQKIVAICSDTWRVEVRPNECTGAKQPWHWMAIPAIGLTMGEMFDVAELARDCAEKRGDDFLFTGLPRTLTGGTGSPINPIAITSCYVPVSPGHRRLGCQPPGEKWLSRVRRAR